MSTKDWVLLIAVGAGLYYLHRMLSETQQKLTSLLDNVGTAIGSGLFEFFNPDPVGETVFYTVTFPDNQRHAVPSRSVSAQGVFKLEPYYGTQRFRLLTDVKTRQRYAAKL